MRNKKSLHLRQFAFCMSAKIEGLRLKNSYGEFDKISKFQGLGKNYGTNWSTRQDSDGHSVKTLKT